MTGVVARETVKSGIILIKQTLARTVGSIKLPIRWACQACGCVGARRAGKVASSAELVTVIIIISCIANARRTVSRSIQIAKGSSVACQTVTAGYGTTQTRIQTGGTIRLESSLFTDAEQATREFSV